MILADGLKHAIISEYEGFFKSEKAYKDLGVPWKRGLVLYGPPGTGKTISLKAIMKSVGVPALYVKSFHTWGGDEQGERPGLPCPRVLLSCETLITATFYVGIREIFTRARREAPCLLILEDLDSLITDENRSFFLNEVDGLEGRSSFSDPLPAASD